MTKTKAGQLLESLVQYRDHGDVKIPTSSTKAVLDAGIYKMSTTMQGEAVFQKHNLVTDELLRFEDDRHTLVLKEVADFWDLREKFKALGFTHKRGLLMHGAPGSGKSCLMKLVMNDIVERGDVVLIGRSPHDLRTCLDQFRKVEPNRRAVVMLEDVDEMARYGEHTLLELFDGDDQIDGVLFMGTTNYLERLAPRMKRAGRFDRTIEIPHPPKAGRLAYLEKKIGLCEAEDPTVLDDIAEATDGFSFGQLREFLVSVYVYGYDPEETINRLSSANLQESASSTSPANEEIKLYEGGQTDAKIIESVAKAGMTGAQKESVKRVAAKKKAKKAKAVLY